MLNLLIHSPLSRVLRALLGTVVFVQGSQDVSRGGVLALIIGTMLIVTAGADVAPGAADTPGNA